MTDTLREFTERYSHALEAYLRDQNEEALQRAYELGRAATANRIGVLDIVWAHQEILSRILRSDGAREEPAQTATLSSNFLSESLAPVEMTQRGFQGAIAALSQRATELTETNKRLEAEIAEKVRMQKELDQAARQREEDIRRFAVKIQGAQEEERQRIARELHDDICQRLSALRLHVNLFEDNSATAANPLQKGLGFIKQQLDGMITDVRRMSANLRPMALDLFGLATAMRILCEEVQKAHSTRITYETQLQSDARYNAQTEIAMYRIAQEALSNAGKHSHAKTVSVSIALRNGTIHLTVQDDGRGFIANGQPAMQSPQGGFGLVNMRERAELLGGVFRLESTPNKGTTVHVELPLMEP